MDTIFILQGLTLLLGFYMAWNIGANDVANAIGTSVGSKALTLKRAVFLAAIFEFAGALLIGSNVSETIQHGIIDPSFFSAQPIVFVLGMMSALLATGVLLQIASYFGLPISTTHSIVGAVLGFGLVAGDSSAIHWTQLGGIAMSWLLSPLLSAFIASLIFFVIEKKILLHRHPITAAKNFTPVFTFLCCYVVSFSLPYQGVAESFKIPSWLLPFSFALLGGFSSAFLKAKILPRPALASEGLGMSSQHSPHSEVEKMFVSLQILSACLVAFAHGTNDVSNAIGPVAAIFGILKAHTIFSFGKTPFWLLAFGGMGIVLGLATWGWRVIETVGKKITELTPSRGFAAEFGAATTILLASKFGMPISTTHALVGAVFGVGMMRGILSVNLKTLRNIFFSWMITIPLCAILSILIFYGLSLFFPAASL